MDGRDAVGFNPVKGATNGSFIAKQMQERYLLLKKGTVLVFMDLHNVDLIGDRNGGSYSSWQPSRERYLRRVP